MLLPMNCLKIYTNRQECQKINSRIEKQVKKDKAGMKKECKVLMLGASDAGKTTLLKQMKIMYGGGFSTREKEDAREIVLSNLVICVYIILCKQCDGQNSEGFNKLHMYTKCLYMNLSSVEKKEISIFTARFIKPSTVYVGEKLSFCPKMRSLILTKIWKDETFTSILLSLGQINLPDSALYFLSHFERLLSFDFLPTNEDIVRMRQSTTGVVEITVPYGGMSLRLIDVGGQRTERRKWIHCFEDVTCILFITSLSGYNMTLVEDPSTNRLDESIALFKTILESKIFNHQTLILFLNKTDIFEKKLISCDLKDNFAEYKGKFNNKEEAQEFILSKFVERRRRIIYSHLTSVVDRDNVSQVFSDIQHTIFQNHMKNIAIQGLF